MSEHYGPFDQYKEVMLEKGGVFGIQPGQTLDVREDGRVVITDVEVAEEEEIATDSEGDDAATTQEMAEAAGTAESPEEIAAAVLPPADSEPSDDAAAAFAKAQENPDE